ncbi:MAG: hypothetical protein QNJ98_10860 [Planctomycetota bacterium]|nr:hypothetical protein [Planctomycetota bacterium]
MTVSSDPDTLLFIEPWTRARAKPVIDELTRKMAGALRAAERTPYESMGYEICACGAASLSHDLILPSGVVTNSLCVHYLAHHRTSIPEDQLTKVATLTCGEAEPNREELQGAPYGRMRRIARFWKPPLWLAFWRWPWDEFSRGYWRRSEKRWAKRSPPRRHRPPAP